MLDRMREDGGGDSIVVIETSARVARTSARARTTEVKSIDHEGALFPTAHSLLEKVVGLTGFVIIHVFIA